MHAVLPILTLEDGQYYFHFAEDKIEAQKGEIGLSLNPGSSTFFFLCFLVMKSLQVTLNESYLVVKRNEEGWQPIIFKSRILFED